MVPTMLTALTMQGAAAMAETMSAVRPQAPAVAQTPPPAAEPATFTSPRMSFDTNVGVIITQYKDVRSGEVKAQFPSEAVVDRYKRSDELETKPKQPAESANAAAAAPQESARTDTSAEAPAPQETPAQPAVLVA